MDEATPTISPRRIGDVLPEGFEFARLGSQLRAVVISSLLVASLAIVGWNAIDPVAENRPLTDSGVFFAIGLHIQEGRTLYSEVWDHKPPLVYWLNATAIEILGPSFSSVRTAERVIAIVALVSTFCALSITFQSRAIGFAGAIAYASFLYENPRIFEQGNLTEEYGAAFILVALAAASLARRFTRPALGLTSAAASGAALALAIFSKEPFLMSAIALISWMAWPIDETVLAAARRALASIAGMAIATLGTVLFLARAENLDEWIDVVEYNFANSAASGASSTLAERFVEGVARVDELVLHGSWFAWLLLAAGALSAFWPEFARKSRGLPAFGAAGLLLAFAGASISARGYGHYYMQLVPFVVVLLASTAGLLLHVSERWLRDMGRQIHALLAMAVLLIPGFLVGQASRLIDISADPPIGATSTWIRERTLPDERIWVPDNQFARIYGESQRLSASRYIFAAPHLFIDAGESSREDRVATLLGDLHRAAPRFVVVHAASHERRVVKEARAWIESACAPVLTTTERLTVLECNPGAQ